MKIGIVGVGMVGETLQYGFERIGHDVYAHDIKWPTRLENLLQTELIFVCVPTPANGRGECDISAVEGVAHDLDKLRYKGLVVIKSTVTPGTTDRLADEHPVLCFAFCPEFLRERSRYSDFVEQHDVCIIGADCKEHFDLIVQAHGSLPKQFVRLEPLEAELAKYFVNVYNAMRITFANQFFNVCEKAGADYTAIKNAVAKRQSIGDYYLECNKRFRSFGGNCLPKDTRAFYQYGLSLGANMELFEDIIALNEIEDVNDIKAA
jgi:UDPglucose 6-dehydrogenase